MLVQCFLNKYDITHSIQLSCSTHPGSAAESVEHVKENKAGEGHCGVTGSDFLVTHL